MLKLKNKRLEISLQEPGEEYRRSRYDWSSFMTDIILDEKHSFAGVESKYDGKGSGGKGLCGEFCMENPPGYEETAVGDYFIKIGIGLARKIAQKKYFFAEEVDIKPLDWQVDASDQSIIFACEQKNHNGYAYKLNKRFSLKDNSLILDYKLTNTGEKDIITQEYNHNYLYFNQEHIGKNYELEIDFDPEFRRKTKEIVYKNRKFTFDQDVQNKFFCEDRKSCLGKIASWKLINKSQGLSVTELLSAPLWKFAVYGKAYIICPELFADVKAPAGKTFSWQRKWVFEG